MHQYSKDAITYTYSDAAGRRLPSEAYNIILDDFHFRTIVGHFFSIVPAPCQAIVYFF